MSRRRYVQIDGQLVEVTSDYVQDPIAPVVWNDLPDYESPVTGLVVSGRRARREDMKRTGCRPWEGMDAEKKEAARRAAEIEKRIDSQVHEAAARSFYELPPAMRRALAGD